MKYTNVKEEELKNKVAQDYFWIYDCTKIIGNVDFCVCMHQSQKELFEQESLLWAEAKTGSSDIFKSIVQLILTIGKARTFDKFLPPSMLGAFDGEKIAFVPYSEIHDFFYQNDFNWNVTPSDHKTKEFQLIYEKTKNIVVKKALLFNYEKDDKELQKFIKSNFKVGKFGLTKTKIDKTNFMVIYNKWFQTVKPTIEVNWEVAKKSGVIDGDFYLADLLSNDNVTLKEKLFVLLKKDHYELDKKLNEAGLFSHYETGFKDNQEAHIQFWNRYDRPPQEEYWNYIVERRDLLVPQDIRERKGSFFTPQIWVELSQKYLTDFFGENWQEEYYVWDCAAGTGNLLVGLTNKYNIYASTLDDQDVKVMNDRIANGANLLPNHVFKFDFLNGKFSELPSSLQDIIKDLEKRKKLILYINPPYAEIAGNKVGVNLSETHDKYARQLEGANRELFAQFLIRIYNEILGCKIAEFSKVKTLSGSNFSVFRNNFLAKLEKCFVVPGDTFDNVKGKFPIGFKIWDTDKKETFVKIKSDVFDRDGISLKKHGFYSYADDNYISKWVNNFKLKDGKYIGWIEGVTRNDFQSQQGICIINRKDQIAVPRGIAVYDKNIMQVCVCFAVRQCIEATWINDRDQFLLPKDGWKKDTEFQNDCLAFTLFHGQNRISVMEGTNHWIPFTEKQIDAKEKFESNFMSDLISGKLKIEDLFTEQGQDRKSDLIFSLQAKALFDTGLKLWQYYHKQKGSNPNASFYDIRAHFQGRGVSGKMNLRSTDTVYTELISELRDYIKVLAQRIEPKVYEYGFLKE